MPSSKFKSPIERAVFTKAGIKRIVIGKKHVVKTYRGKNALNKMTSVLFSDIHNTVAKEWKNVWSEDAIKDSELVVLEYIPRKKKYLLFKFIIHNGVEYSVIGQKFEYNDGVKLL